MGFERGMRRAVTIGGAATAMVLAVTACSGSGETSSGASSTTAGGGVGVTSAPGGTVAPNGTAAPGAGATGGAAASAITFPGAAWSTATAADAGLDQAVLDEVKDEAAAGGSMCMVVTRNGELVDEWYADGAGPETTTEAFSATKSYTSMLVGIAQDQGKLSIDDSASKYITAWQGTPAEAVTVRNLLSNDSGRHWDGVTDYVTMATQSLDKTQFAIDLAQDDPPGEIWAYNNSAIQTLDEVLQVATGESPSAYAEEHLLGPIGMADSEMRKDASGNTLTFMGLSSTCRDMARFGTLLLADGTWDGRQIVSADYVEEATSPSQDINEGYGFLIWLNTNGKLANPVQPTTGKEGDSRVGQMVPGAPEDMFWALGLGNQIVAVDPGSGVVAVRMGPVNVPEGSTQFTQANLARIVTEGLTD